MRIFPSKSKNMQYNKDKNGGVRQFGAKYITGGNPVW